MAEGIQPDPPAVPWRGLTLLTAAALVLRIVGLDQSSLWLDEAFEVTVARSPLGEAILYETNHPPLHRLLLGLWIRAFGTSDIAVRALAALFGTLTVPALFALADRAAGRRAAWIAGALAALSPYLVYYSREARGYALLVLLATVSCHTWIAWSREKRRRSRLVWVVTAVLGLHTHYFFAFVLLAQLGDGLLLPERRRRLREAVVPVAIVVALTLPWAVHAATHLSPQDRSYIVSPLANLAVTLLRFCVGYGLAIHDSTTASRSAGEQALAALPVAVAALLAFGPALVRGIRRPAVGRRLLVLLLALPAVLLLLLSPVLPLLHDRYLAFAAPAFVVLAAHGAATLPRRLGLVAVLLMLAISLAGDVREILDPRCRKEDWRAAADTVAGQEAPGDVIVLDAGYVRFAFDHYYRGGRPRLPGGPDLASRLDLRSPERVWLVLSHVDPEGSSAKDLLDGLLRRKREWVFPRHWGIRVSLYERQGPPGRGVEHR